MIMYNNDSSGTGKRVRIDLSDEFKKYTIEYRNAAIINAIVNIVQMLLSLSPYEIVLEFQITPTKKNRINSGWKALFIILIFILNSPFFTILYYAYICVRSTNNEIIPSYFPNA